MTVLEDFRWHCTCCGREMTGLPQAIAFDCPLHWTRLDEVDRVRSSLTPDFCRIETETGVARYIRCVLPLPVPEIADEFEFGVWTSVSERSWDIYSDGFQTDVYATDGCFGYLGNNIAAFAPTL